MAHCFIEQVPQFRKFVGYLAIMGGVLLLAALVFSLLGVHYNYALLIVGFGTLAVVAFLLGSLFPTDATAPMAQVRAVAMKLLGWGLAVVLIGALFVLMQWQGGKTLLIAGGLCLAVAAIAWLVYLVRRNGDNQI